MKERLDEMFLDDILESIEAIEEFSINITIKELSINRMKKNAIIRELEIIGEASKNISDSIKDNSSIKWSKIIGVRNIVIHRYFRIDLDAVLGIINKDIPELKKEVQRIKRGLI